MLDVLHVFFEEDMLPSWESGAELKSTVRSQIFKDMYEEDYKYGFSSSKNSGDDWNGVVGPSFYDEPSDGSIKPYIPPTDEEDLHAFLGGPMGE